VNVCSTCGTLLGIRGTPLIHGVVMSLSEFSNTELIAHLREKIETSAWTPAEFVEAERRGENCLDADPELATAFWAKRDRLVAPLAAALREAYEPTRTTLAELAGHREPLFLADPHRFLDIPDAVALRHEELVAPLQRIAGHTRRDWVFWVQFGAVLLGVALAGAALLI